MQIHVVQTGETLSDIALMYNTTIIAVSSVNGMTPTTPLVVGQALVIPIIGSYYYVQEGDTLYKIAQKNGLDFQRLAQINNIPISATLDIGQKLYIPPPLRDSVEINAYVEPLGTTVPRELVIAVRDVTPYLTYLAPFSFQIQRDGTLREPPLDDLPAITKATQTTILMAVTNLEEGMFSSDLARTILSNAGLQDRLISNIIATAQKINVSDIHFDLEFIPPTFKEEYANFLKRAKVRFSQAGLLMSVALAPKTSATQTGLMYEAHDYGTIGKIADFVVLMTYEWGYSAGPPMPVSPLPEVRKVVEYALTEMPAEKIMMGQNLYGYDWTLPYVKGGPNAKSLSPQRALETARQYNVNIQYDDKNQAPFIEYADENNKNHIIWFEDARSIQAKFDLVKELELRGISYWKLGLPFPQNWALIYQNFFVVKRR